MGLLSYLKGVSSQAVNRSKQMYHSKVMRFGVLATVAAFVFLPVAAPLMALLLLAAPLAYHSAMSLVRPAFSGFSWSSFFGGGSFTSADTSQKKDSKITTSSKKRDVFTEIPKGKNTGDAMVDLLIDKLRAAGLTVTTDWEMSEKFLKTLPGKYDHLKDSSGNIYGFVYEGIIHINPKHVTVETPIHEYTHLWAEALRHQNPEEWEKIKGMLKNETYYWDKIVKSYPHLETDDEIADEVLATLSGKKGDIMFDEHYQKGDDPNVSLENIKVALQRFWSAVCNFLGIEFTKVDDVCDAVLADMLKGVNPMEYMKDGVSRLSDTKPLGQVSMTQNQKEEKKEGKHMEQKNNINLLTGEEAQRAVECILAFAKDDGKGNVSYDTMVGTAGFYKTQTGSGQTVYAAFDNSDGQCWCEDFKTENGALMWCTGVIASAEDVRKMETKNEISDILRSYQKAGFDSTFFRVSQEIGERELTMGILYDNSEHNHHTIVYPSKMTTGMGMPFETCREKDLMDLNETQLEELKGTLQDMKDQDKLVPVHIREVIDDTLSSDEDVFVGVTFEKPYDQELQDLGDRHGCETMDRDTCECILPDFDAAMRYSYEGTNILSRRGDFYREVGSHGEITWHVTVESDDIRLVDVAKRHNGDADVTNLGTPLVMAYFGNLKDAKAYRDEVKSLGLSTSRKDVPSEYLFNGRRQDENGRLTDKEKAMYLGSLTPSARRTVDSFLSSKTSDVERGQLLGRIQMDPINGKFWAGTWQQDVAVMKLLYDGIKEKSVGAGEDIKSFADIDRYGRAWAAPGHKNIETIILSEHSFEALKKEAKTLPPEVKFDESGEYLLDMEFHDGYAFDLNPHGYGYYDRVALYYPTIEEVSKDRSLQADIERYTGREWSKGSDFEKMYDIALKFGQASRMRCPDYRRQDAIKAIVERAGDPSAKSFTPEQRKAIMLAGECHCPNNHPAFDRQSIFDLFFELARVEMKSQGIMKEWQDDVHEELRDLAMGKVRDESLGLKR